MKLDNNWKLKTIENLENDYWEEPDYSSHLVTTCHLLRKKQLKDFEIEDLRIMIGQNIGLIYLVPIAIDKLNEDILAEGDYFEGDLLLNVLTCEKEYWLNNINNWKIVCELFMKNKYRLENSDYVQNKNSKLFDAYSVFEKINKFGIKV